MDFDGVTHPWGEAEDFRCLPLIEDVLRGFEEAKIIISSDWRMLFSLPKLRSRFSEDIRPRVLGAGLMLSRPLNAGESAIVQAYIERGYDTFLSRCAEGRGKTKAAIDSIGQGRIWSGNQALNNGLVDELGGIDKAVEIAAGLAGIEQYSIKEYPEQKDFFSQLMEESMKNTETRILEVFIGKEALKQKQMIKTWQTFDVRQAIMPVVMK